MQKAHFGAILFSIIFLISLACETASPANAPLPTSTSASETQSESNSKAVEVISPTEIPASSTPTSTNYESKYANVRSEDFVELMIYEGNPTTSETQFSQFSPSFFEWESIIAVVTEPNNILVIEQDADGAKLVQSGITNESKSVEIRWSFVSQRGTKAVDGVLYIIGSKTPDGKSYFVQDYLNGRNLLLKADASWIESLLSFDNQHFVFVTPLPTLTPIPITYVTHQILLSPELDPRIRSIGEDGMWVSIIVREKATFEEMTEELANMHPELRGFVATEPPTLMIMSNGRPIRGRGTDVVPPNRSLDIVYFSYDDPINPEPINIPSMEYTIKVSPNLPDDVRNHILNEEISLIFNLDRLTTVRKLYDALNERYPALASKPDSDSQRFTLRIGEEFADFDTLDGPMIFENARYYGIELVEIPSSCMERPFRRAECRR